MKNKEIEELLNYYRKEVNKYEESSKFLEKKFGYSQEVINSIDQRLYQRYRNHKLLLSYIEQLENNRDKAIEYLEKSKLNQLNTYCKYLYIDFDAEKIENIDELIEILKGDSDV